ncbi:Hypothetical Protein FCC1311_082782 [Hondaea fermentalgiana]|uniref:Uncharacterized protein n=1 Tax=Hondaea fermentalgiana TaxID=2315210 RepID=A0A2R5GTT7_9STRA|nr:Hypothetical Protein FCC1311_082782 [Hondaea fermentalgiana]|eukprot:GBG32053.1 Hypothetical Protein FCC1311_082782 [Hondaea fermentalgiana]
MDGLHGGDIDDGASRGDGMIPSPVWATEVSFEVEQEGDDNGELGPFARETTSTQQDQDQVQAPLAQNSDTFEISRLDGADSWEVTNAVDDDVDDISALDVSIEHASAYDSDSEVFLEQLNMLSLNDHDDEQDQDCSPLNDPFACAKRKSAAPQASHPLPPPPPPLPHVCIEESPARVKPALTVMNPFFSSAKEHFPPWDEAFREVADEDTFEEALKDNGDLNLSIDTMAVLNAEVFDRCTPVKCINPPGLLRDPNALALESKLPIEHLRTPFVDGTLPPSGRKVRRTLRATGKAVQPHTPGSLLFVVMANATFANEDKISGPRELQLTLYNAFPRDFPNDGRFPDSRISSLVLVVVVVIDVVETNRGRLVFTSSRTFAFGVQLLFHDELTRFMPFASISHFATIAIFATAARSEPPTTH